MGIKHLILLVAALMPLPIFAAIGDTFTARTEEAVLVTYYVTSETKKEVQVGFESGIKPAISKTQKGIVTIPEEVNGYRVSAIGQHAFYKCTEITEVVLPESIELIGRYAFSGCSSLSRIILPEDLEEIEHRAFYEATSLYQIEIPDNVLFLGEACFRECTSLYSVYIGEGIEEIPEDCFYKCASLKEIELSDEIVSIGEQAFAFCSCLQELPMSEGVEEIRSNAFQECVDLVEVELGSNVQRVYREVFSGCTNLETLIFGENVDSIAKHIVDGCKKLKRIEVKNKIPSVNVIKTTFYYSSASSSTYMKIYQNVPLYVPKGCKEIYENAPVWQYFSTIVEVDDEDGITHVSKNAHTSKRYYSLDGKEVSSPKRGVNIVRDSDGNIRTLLKRSK